jgi:hypothetical protein
MKEFLEALSRQITTEEAKKMKRQMQLASPGCFIGEPLQMCREDEFISQMRRAWKILTAVEECEQLILEHDEVTICVEEKEREYNSIQLQVKITPYEFEFVEVKEYD